MLVLVMHVRCVLVLMGRRLMPMLVRMLALGAGLVMVVVAIVVSMDVIVRDRVVGMNVSVLFRDMEVGAQSEEPCRHDGCPIGSAAFDDECEHRSHERGDGEHRAGPRGANSPLREQV
jgi:hypothetical protein